MSGPTKVELQAEVAELLALGRDLLGEIILAIAEIETGRTAAGVARLKATIPANWPPAQSEKMGD
jgi:hypothetical protein